MATLVTPGYDDALLDALVDKLAAFRDEQAVLSSGAWFGVERDNMEPWRYDSGTTPPRPRPLVNITCDSDTYEPRGSTPRKQRQGSLAIKFECWVPLSASRLYLLKEQVLAGIWGLSVGELCLPTTARLSLPWPSWTRTDLEGIPPLEYDIFAGAWSVDIPHAWTPSEDAGTPIDSISVVSLGRFAALYSL